MLGLLTRPPHPNPLPRPKRRGRGRKKDRSCSILNPRSFLNDLETFMTIFIATEFDRHASRTIGLAPLVLARRVTQLAQEAMQGGFAMPGLSSNLRRHVRVVRKDDLGLVAEE